MSTIRVATTACLFIATAASAAAQTRDCRSIADPKERLACFDAQPKTAPKDAPAAKAKASPNEAHFAKARAAIAKSLKDPESARFTNLTIKTAPNAKGVPTDFVCGEVNAKNTYGGYVGAKPFVYFIKTGLIQIVGGDTDPIMHKLASDIYKQYCLGVAN